jgi:hypothetical protein
VASEHPRTKFSERTRNQKQPKPGQSAPQKRSVCLAPLPDLTDDFKCCTILHSLLFVYCFSLKSHPSNVLILLINNLWGRGRFRGKPWRALRKLILSVAAASVKHRRLSPKTRHAAVARNNIHVPRKVFSQGTSLAEPDSFLILRSRSLALTRECLALAMNFLLTTRDPVWRFNRYIFSIKYIMFFWRNCFGNIAPRT